MKGLTLDGNKRQKAPGWLDPYFGNDAQVLADNARYYMATTQCFDREFTDGAGVVVYDAKSRSYVDFCSRVGSANLGHNDPELNAVALEFIGRYGFAGPVPHHEAPNRFAVALEKELCERMPKEFTWQCFFGNSGTEAVEAALKVCADYRRRRNETERTGILAFENAFHGRTLGALSFNTNPLHCAGYGVAYERVNWFSYPAAHPYFSRRFEVRHENLSDPMVAWTKRCDYSTLETLPKEYEVDLIAYTKLLWGEPAPVSAISALIVEDGVQGEGGMNVRNPYIMQRIFEWCHKHGILIILDAVQSGIGRTGKLFAFEHDGFVPDVLTLGKSLGAGLPLGVMICKKEIAFTQPGRHSNTNGGNPLICRVGLEVLRIIERRKILERVEKLTTRILTPALQDIEKSFDRVVHSVRNLGFMGGIEFWDSKTRKPDPELRDAVIQQGLDHGLLLLGCGVCGIRIMPPLVISPECLRVALRTLKNCIGLAYEASMRTSALVTTT